jgi:hypothetical protein
VFAQVGAVLLLARRTRWVAYALLVLLLADLTAPAGRAFQRFYPQLDAPPAWRDTLASLGPDERVMTIAGSHANLMTQLGVEDAWGYDPAMPARWGDLVGRLVGADPRAGDFTVRRIEPSSLWSMLRVRQTLPPMPTFAPSSLLPRVLFVDDAAVVEGPAASLAAVFDPSFRPLERVVLESIPSPAPVKGGAVLFRETKREQGTLEIEVVLDRPCIMVVTDAYSAGWRVRPLTAAQKEYTVLPADHALRAVPLSAGTHKLLLEYAPRSVTIGFVVSAIAWATFLGAAVGHAIQRRRLATRTTAL